MIRFAEWCNKYPIFPIAWTGLAYLITYGSDVWYTDIWATFMGVFAGMNWIAWYREHNTTELAKRPTFTPGNINVTFRRLYRLFDAGELQVTHVRRETDQIHEIDRFEVQLVWPRINQVRGGEPL